MTGWMLFALFVGTIVLFAIIAGFVHSRQLARKTDGWSGRRFLSAYESRGVDPPDLDDVNVNIRWCCLGFRGHTEIAGERGFAIFSDTGETPIRVVLQYRAMDSDVEFPRIVIPQPVSWVSDMVIQFCPWCGRHLQSWYGRHLEEFGRPDLAIRLDYE